MLQASAHKRVEDVLSGMYTDTNQHSIQSQAKHTKHACSVHKHLVQLDRQGRGDTILAFGISWPLDERLICRTPCFQIRHVHHLLPRRLEHPHQTHITHETCRSVNMSSATSFASCLRRACAIATSNSLMGPGVKPAMAQTAGQKSKTKQSEHCSFCTTHRQGCESNGSMAHHKSDTTATASTSATPTHCTPLGARLKVHHSHAKHGKEHGIGCHQEVIEWMLTTCLHMVHKQSTGSMSLHNCQHCMSA